jgi:6-phosphofructokinase 1
MRIPYFREMKELQRIGVLTSGGDAPGMNACIRAVVRTALHHGLAVSGIYRGYEGLIDGEIAPLDGGSVSGILHLGGTVLKTSRSKRFQTVEGRAAAYANLQAHGIDALVVIGGDGSYRGAQVLLDEYPDLRIVGCPGTIDNDLFGTELTIGYDTALNTAVEAIDRIRDTATATNRLFFVEVMGRDSGFLALAVGVASGAEAVLVPETVTDMDALIRMLEAGWARQKSSMIIVVAEGDDAGGAFDIAAKVKARFDQYDTRVSVLGHIQRGGSPTCADRVLAARLGNAAVEALIAGKSGLACGLVNNELSYTPFRNAGKSHKTLNPDLLRLVEVLSV